MPITIGGTLYSSREWYEENIAKKGKKAVGGREVSAEPTAPTPIGGVVADRAQGLGGIEAGVSGVAQQIQSLIKRIQTEGITRGTTGEVLQAPTLGGFGAGGGRPGTEGFGPPPGGAGVGYPPTGQTAYGGLIDKLTAALTTMTGGPTMEEQLGTMREERGVPELRETVGTFEEEIGKAQGLLSDLDMRIRRGMVAEEARRIPMPLIVGRKAELQAQASLERGDVLAAIETLQRGRGQAESALEREEADILTILGLREKERTQPLEQLTKELTIRKSIRDLTKTEIPSAVSSTFDDAGNLTIVMQDPTTGAFTTKTIQGIGKKAAAYSSFSIQTDKYGNVTIIGIKPDGTTAILGTFEGVAKVAEKEYTPPSSYKEWELAGKPGTYEDWLRREDKPYGTYTTRLKEEIDNLYKGRHGKEGSREKILNILQREFPGRDVTGDIYARVPDGYEAKIKAEEVDVEAWTEEQRGILQQYKDANWSKKDTENKWKADFGVDAIPGPIEKIFDEIFGTWKL